MGGSIARVTAKQEVDNINNVTANYYISANQGCSTGQEIRQNIKLGDLDGVTGLTIEANATQVTNLVCFSELDATVDQSTSLSNAIKSDLKASAEAGQIVGYGESDTQTESINRNVNNIATNVSVSSLQTCIAEQFAEQNVEIGNIKNSSEITITIASSQNAMVNCLQKQSTYISNVTEVANAVTASTDANASSGFDLGTIIGLIIAVIIVIIIVSLLTFTSLPATILNLFIGTVKGVGSGVGAIISTASTPEMSQVPSKK